MLCMPLVIALGIEAHPDTEQHIYLYSNRLFCDRIKNKRDADLLSRTVRGKIKNLQYANRSVTKNMLTLNGCVGCARDSVCVCVCILCGYGKWINPKWGSG